MSTPPRQRLLAPLVADRLAVFGDVARYACAGDARVSGLRGRDGGVELELLGAAGERVELSGWSEGPVAIRAGDGPPLQVAPDAGGIFRSAIDVGPEGRRSVQLQPLSP